jgi:hypothetical protein
MQNTTKLIWCLCAVLCCCQPVRSIRCYPPSCHKQYKRSVYAVEHPLLWRCPVCISDRAVHQVSYCIRTWYSLYPTLIWWLIKDKYKILHSVRASLEFHFCSPTSIRRQSHTALPVVASSGFENGITKFWIRPSRCLSSLVLSVLHVYFVQLDVGDAHVGRIAFRLSVSGDGSGCLAAV